MFRYVCELTLEIMVNSHSLTSRGSSEVWRSKAALIAVTTRWWSSGSCEQGDLLRSVPWDKALEERGAQKRWLIFKYHITSSKTKSPPSQWIRGRETPVKERQGHCPNCSRRHGDWNTSPVKKGQESWDCTARRSLGKTLLWPFNI